MIRHLKGIQNSTAKHKALNCMAIVCNRLSIAITITHIQ